VFFFFFFKTSGFYSEKTQQYVNDFSIFESIDRAYTSSQTRAVKANLRREQEHR